VVRTGQRAAQLRGLLADAGLRPVAVSPPRPTGDEHADEVLEVYRRLGGLLDRSVLRPGGWDLVFEGGLVVELDEELHFNHYRALTLKTSWSANLPWVEDYERLCADHEGECLLAGNWGRRWTNDSCARMFSGGVVGDLSGAGAPRWKQRALYDAIKDTAPNTGLGISLARVSIYDRDRRCFAGGGAQGPRVRAHGSDRRTGRTPNCWLGGPRRRVVAIPRSSLMPRRHGFDVARLGERSCMRSTHEGPRARSRCWGRGLSARNCLHGDRVAGALQAARSARAHPVSWCWDPRIRSRSARTCSPSLIASLVRPAA
jgi:hypothetical protein